MEAIESMSVGDKLTLETNVRDWGGESKKAYQFANSHATETGKAFEVANEQNGNRWNFYLVRVK